MNEEIESLKLEIEELKQDISEKDEIINLLKENIKEARYYLNQNI